MYRVAECPPAQEELPMTPIGIILGSDALRLVAQARAEFDTETARRAKLPVSTDYQHGEQIP
jgi:hypothetical protein